MHTLLPCQTVEAFIPLRGNSYPVQTVRQLLYLQEEKLNQRAWCFLWSTEAVFVRKRGGKGKRKMSLRISSGPSLPTQEVMEVKIDTTINENLDMKVSNP